MKRYLFVLGVAFVALLLGFILGRANIKTPLNQSVDTVITATKKAVQEKPTDVSEATQKDNDTQSTGTAKDDTTSPLPLTSGQRNMLQSFGINPDEFVITQEMVLCAEAKLGPARILEIQNGATPSLLEGASLVGCYQ